MCVHVVLVVELRPGLAQRTTWPQRSTLAPRTILPPLTTEPHQPSLTEVTEQPSENLSLATRKITSIQDDSNDDTTGEPPSYTNCFTNSKFAVDTKVKRGIFYMEKCYYGMISFVQPPLFTIHLIDPPYRRKRDQQAGFWQPLH